MPKKTVRFAFAIVQGPNAGLRAPGWRVWTHGDTTYITAKSLGDTWKTSLHGDVSWQHAVPKEHFRENPNPIWRGADRAPWKFTPTPFVDGVRLAFVVAAARGSLLVGDIPSNEIVVPVEDRYDWLSSVFIWMTEPDVPFDGRALIGGPLPLSNGRQVWMTQNREVLEGEVVEPLGVADGAVVEPLWPEKHGTACPGLLLKGLRWG